MEVCLYVGKNDVKDYLKASKKLKYKPEAKGLGEVSGFLMWVRNGDDMSVIVHELSHMVDNIINHYNLEGGEIRAFLIEYLYYKIAIKDQEQPKKEH